MDDVPAIMYRYLTNLPGVRSGRTIIEGTRIGVHDVMGLSGGLNCITSTVPESWKSGKLEYEGE